MQTNSFSLTPTTFHILLSLVDRELHGYGIIKQVEHDTDGGMKLLTGTLYSTLKRLVDDGLISESELRPTPEYDDERRRYYALTEKGRKALGTEMNRYQAALKIGYKHNLLKPFNYV